jgi:hypothetical protein
VITNKINTIITIADGVEDLTQMAYLSWDKWQRNPWSITYQYIYALLIYRKLLTEFNSGMWYLSARQTNSAGHNTNHWEHIHQK